MIRCIRRLLGMPVGFTEQEYAEALTDNLMRDRETGTQQLRAANERSERVTREVAHRASNRSEELRRILEHVSAAQRNAEDASDLLRKIVEGPS